MTRWDENLYTAGDSDRDEIMGVTQSPFASVFVCAWNRLKKLIVSVLPLRRSV